MARIFTVSFSFDNEVYNTMVTVQTTPLYVKYTLTNLDADLLSLLPGNKIISPAPRQFVFPNATFQNSSVLMNSIIKAMSVHLLAVKDPLSP